MVNQIKAEGLFENENGFIIISETQKEKCIEGGDSFRSKVVFLYKGKKGDVIRVASDDYSLFSIYYDRCRYTRSETKNNEVKESSHFTRLYDEDFVRDAAKEFGSPICTEDDLEERWEKENPEPSDEAEAPKNITLSFTRSFPDMKRGLYSVRKLSTSLKGLTFFLQNKGLASINDVAMLLVIFHSHSSSHDLPSLELTSDYVRITSPCGNNSLKFEDTTGSGSFRITWDTHVGVSGFAYQRAAKKHGWDAVENE